MIKSFLQGSNLYNASIKQRFTRNDLLSPKSKERENKTRMQNTSQGFMKKTLKGNFQNKNHLFTPAHQTRSINDRYLPQNGFEMPEIIERKSWNIGGNHDINCNHLIYKRLINFVLAIKDNAWKTSQSLRKRQVSESWSFRPNNLKSLDINKIVIGHQSISQNSNNIIRHNHITPSNENPVISTDISKIMKSSKSMVFINISN